MAITEIQSEILKCIAANRISQGESYVAGGVALNKLIESSRISRDIDLFHDTADAVLQTWEADRILLEKNKYAVEETRILPSYIEAIVSKGKETVLMQWTRDSAFRFFPLLEDELFGLVLHPFDLATNKVLALAGRLEARDWIDVINCHDNLQSIGYLFWAACGKDPGFNPLSLLFESKRSSHYSAEEIGQLSFEGPAPDVSVLGEKWHYMLKEAENIIGLLPPEEAGTCILNEKGELYAGDAVMLETALQENGIWFHKGTIKGAYPRFRS